MPTYEELLRRAQHYIEQPGNEAGGNLHIMLEDANLEDTHLAWCQGYCDAKEDYAGSYIAGWMTKLSMDDRFRLVEELVWPF